MASTQKKSTRSGGKRTPSKSAAASKQTGRKTGTKTNRKKVTPAAPSFHREIGGIVCLVLAFFGSFGYFGVQAAFIDLFCHLLRGLCGYGYYLVPPVLVLCGYILLFHRRRPVRLRLTCALLLPVLFGGIFHLILSGTRFSWGWNVLDQLWQTGLRSSSGGVLGGLIAMSFRYAFSQIGGLVLLVVAVVPIALYAFNRTPVEVYLDIRSWLEEREEEREEPWQEEGEFQEEYVEPEPPVAREKGRKASIDIPVDDAPLAEKGSGQTEPPVRKKKLFERAAKVPTPDQVLTDTVTPAPEEHLPEVEDLPEIFPVSQTEPEEHQTLPQAAEHTPAAAQPAVEKVTRQEAQQAQAQVAQEIEAGMEQDTGVYRYPPVSLLTEGSGMAAAAAGELQTNQQRLQDALVSFGVDAHIVNVTRGPSVTRYELELEQGVKLNKITNLSDDIALALGASAVRVAPIPDKISTVGIEVPNRQVSPVAIRDVISDRAFTDSPSKVSFAVGKDIGGNCVVGNIAKLPHMLIAGTTGSGKSVCTNSLIISLLYKSTPDEVRLIMVDPKMVELGVYNGIPHLLIPVVTDPKKAAGALQWAVCEMMKRYKAFSEVGAKDLASYNNHARKSGRDTMPQIVVVIDELADLMLVAAKEVEESICRVAQMGRASGMHLVIATQRPSADVITGLMKANIPSRIAFAVASSLESRIILDTTGAEKLVGKGDMLYAPLGQGKPQRVQGCFISEEEVAQVVDFIKQGSTAHYDESVMHEIEKHAEEKEKGAKGVGGSDPNQGGDYDELLPAAIDVVLEVGQASVSMLQRRLKLGYGRAARLVDQMEEKGVVGPFEGSKPRQLLITKEQWQEMQYRQNMVDTVPEPSEPVPEEFPFEGDAVEQSRDLPPF